MDWAWSLLASPRGLVFFLPAHLQEFALQYQIVSRPTFKYQIKHAYFWGEFDAITHVF